MRLSPISKILRKVTSNWTNFQIWKFFFHQVFDHDDGDFLESKNSKNRDPKGVFHPNTIFKSHQFVVMFLTLKTADKGKCPNAPNVWKIMSKWWFLKILFGSKTNLGFRFLKIFTSKNMPPYGTCAGWKNFQILKIANYLNFGHLLSWKGNSLNKEKELLQVTLHDISEVSMWDSFT